MRCIGSEFELTEDHIKLIREMHIDFDPSGYDGAPTVNCKRPYGNSGNQAYEVYRILHGEYWDYGEEDEEMPEDLEEQYMKLHEETALALQMMTLFGEIKPGKFKKTFYGIKSWERVE